MAEEEDLEAEEDLFLEDVVGEVRLCLDQGEDFRGGDGVAGVVDMLEEEEEVGAEVEAQVVH